jgi:hypothetical protein
MNAPVLKTKHGALYRSSGERAGPVYLKFVIVNTPEVFWDAIKELNDSLARAHLQGHQIMINQGAFLRMHGTHVQVRLNSAADFEQLLFAHRQTAKSAASWADEVDEALM